jgi:hypothetical protein
MPTMTNGANGQPARLMTIGEVARRSGFTIRRLRFYERRGLLAPAARRASGYRLYGEHPDHRAVGAAVVDACYFRAPGPLYYPAHGREGLGPHRVREILLIMSDHADHVVDIAPTFERKVRAIRAHASQFGKHPDLEAFLRGLATRAGQAFGVTVAESFKRLTP